MPNPRVIRIKNRNVRNRQRAEDRFNLLFTNPVTGRQSKRRQRGKLSPAQDKALISALKIDRNDVNGEVMTIDSDQNNYKGFYFERSIGSSTRPVVVIDQLRDATEATLSELIGDIGFMRETMKWTQAPAEIYLAPVDNLDDNAREQLIKDTITKLNKVQAPAGQAYQRDFFNGYVKLKLEKIPELITVKNQVMSANMFEQAMGGPPNIGKLQHAEVIKALNAYQDTLDQQVKAIERGSDEPDLTLEEFKQANNAVKDKVRALRAALEAYDAHLTNKSKATFIQTKNKNAAREQAKVFASLKQQIEQQIDAANYQVVDTNLELQDVNATLQTVRLNNLIKKYRPLRDSHIKQDGVLLGEGAQGPVYSKILDTSDRPDLPTNFEAGVKFNTDFANGEAIGSGISKTNPEEAKRAVASYEVSKLLGLDVIPPTTFLLTTNNRTQQQELGYAMQRVIGVDGQLSERSQQQIKPVNVPLDTNPLIQKELADLQILDNVIGHADRHFGNLRFEGTGPNNIKGVRGIDNDDTFGSQWVTRGNPRPDDFSKWSSKTPPVPPIIDAHTAISVLKVNLTDLEPLKTTLSPAEYKATEDRLKTVQNIIQDRIKAGKLAIMPGQTLSDADKDFLAVQGQLSSPESLSALPQWGDPQVYRAHLPPAPAPGAQTPPTNSYLGEMFAMGNDLGKIDWPSNG